MKNNTKLNRGRQLLTDANRLSLVRPNVVAEWHPTKNNPLTPNDFSFASNKTVWWICLTHRTAFSQKISERFRGRTRCRYCIQQKRRENNLKPKGGKSLAESFPHLVLEWHPTKNTPRTPHDVGPGSSFVAW